PGAEERNRHAPGEDIRLGRHDGLTAVTGKREQVKERLAGSVERFELAVGVDLPGAQLGDRPRAADGRDVVADGAARPVERRTEALLGSLDLEEVFEAETELLEFDGRDPGERTPERLRLRPRARDRDDEHSKRRGDGFHDGLTRRRACRA